MRNPVQSVVREPNWEITQTGFRLTLEKDFDQVEVSILESNRLPFTISSITQTGLNVLLGKIREVV